MSTVLNEMRRHIKKSGQSRYAIWKATDIDQSQLSRFMAGRCGLSFDATERLAKYLGLEIVIRPKRQRKGR